MAKEAIPLLPAFVGEANDSDAILGGGGRRNFLWGADLPLPLSSSSWFVEDMVPSRGGGGAPGGLGRAAFGLALIVVKRDGM